MKKIIIPLILNLLLSNYSYAQTAGPDFFRSTGKIYVVVSVIAVVFIGIILFLVYLDRKLTKLENQINEKN